MGVAAGDQRSPERRAPRAARNGVPERDTLRGYAVQIWGVGVWVAHMPHRVGAVLVSEYPDYVLHGSPWLNSDV